MTLLRGGKASDDSFTAERANIATPSTDFRFEDLSGSLGGVAACWLPLELVNGWNIFLKDIKALSSYVVVGDQDAPCMSFPETPMHSLAAAPGPLQHTSTQLKTIVPNFFLSLTKKYNHRCSPYRLDDLEHHCDFFFFWILGLALTDVKGSTFNVR